MPTDRHCANISCVLQHCPKGPRSLAVQSFAPQGHLRERERTFDRRPQNSLRNRALFLVRCRAARSLVLPESLPSSERSPPLSLWRQQSWPWPSGLTSRGGAESGRPTWLLTRVWRVRWRRDGESFVGPAHGNVGETSQQEVYITAWMSLAL